MPHIRGLAKKQQVTNESLKKIEKGDPFFILFSRPFLTDIFVPSRVQRRTP